MAKPVPSLNGHVRTPTLLQMEAVECGSAALGIILEYFGRIVPLAELRRECNVSSHGVNAYNLRRAARYYGLEVRAQKLKPDELRQQPCPLIIHWNFDHFLVVEGFGENRVFVNDPAFGRRTIPLTEFGLSYTGVALLLRPGPAFKKGGCRPPVWSLLWHPLRESWPAALYCLVAGLLLVVPGLVMPILTQVFVDSILLENRQDWLRPLLVGMALVGVLQAALRYLQTTYQRRLRLKLAVAMASRFTCHLFHLPIGYFARRYAGEVSNRVSLNDRVADFAVGPVAGLAIQIVQVIFYGAIMFTYDVLLTSIALLGVGLNVLILRTVVRRRRDFQMRLTQEDGKLGGLSIAGLQSIETLKASALEDSFFVRWAATYAKVLLAQQQLGLSGLNLAVLRLVLVSLVNTLVLVVGGLRVMDGHLTIGMLVAFQGLTLGFQGPIAQLSNLSYQIQQMHVSLTRLADVHANPLDPGTSPPAELAAQTLHRLRGHVELRHLSFGYSSAEPPLLEDLSLTIRPGQWVALVGETGAGKSTAAKLVAGLYEPWGGEILLDGQPRRQLPIPVLANGLAYVEQDAGFFAGSLEDNLTLWDDSVPYARLLQGCRDAAIHDVLQSKPGGYAAELREAATNFSGGERQRLELARALLRDPVVLILDEATNGLDTETEFQILQNIRRRGCSALLIAHRLSAIRACDEILVLRNGRIVERGHHEELITRSGEYARLIRTEGEAIGGE